MAGSPMRTALCEAFGIDYPIFAFTPSEHVAAEVSKAGGLGVLGCVRFNDPDELEQTLTWLETPTGDLRPAGLMPDESDATVLLEGDASTTTGVGITVEPDGGSEQPTTDPIAFFEVAT